MLRSRKFTVREISVMGAVVAVVLIVSILAIRSYYQYFLRARIIAAVSGLAETRTKMERYFQKHLTYNNPAEPPCTEGSSLVPLPTDPNFTFSCPTLSATQVHRHRDRHRLDAGISVFHRPEQQSVHAESAVGLDGSRFCVLGDPAGRILLMARPGCRFRRRPSTSGPKCARRG